MKTKPILKPRGVRFSDEQWELLKKTAKREGVTASDVVRYAVNKMMITG